MDDKDKMFEAMLSTLFECADCNTEDMEEFAEEYLTSLRTLAAQAGANARDAELGRRFRELASKQYAAKDCLLAFGADCFDLVAWMVAEEQTL